MMSPQPSSDYFAPPITNQCLPTSSTLTVRDVDLSEWHAFLARTPGGSYQQTGWWAIAKLLEGFRARRFVIRNGDTILGGAQMLYRPLPVHGAVAYVPLGPVLASEDPEVANLALTHLHRIGRELDAYCLAVQPPRWGRAFARKLQNFGFCPASMDLAPNASVVIDLSNSLDFVLSKMHKTTRYDIRASQRKGIAVRDGGLEDIDAIHRLLLATAKRRGFSGLKNDYLREIWRTFSGGGHTKIFVAEFEGRLVSAALLMSFGDTVTYWKAGWSGEYSNRYPNEALQWAAIQWAKSNGYRYYDLGGINRALAKSALEGVSIRKPAGHSVGFYKLGFGGQIELFPKAQMYIYSQPLRRAWSMISKRAPNQNFLPNVLRRIW
jgi:lipid II:glycine glycyltransferase (peptidoglycan interpeptide bridge formation enzyme)